MEGRSRGVDAPHLGRLHHGVPAASFGLSPLSYRPCLRSGARRAGARVPCSPRPQLAIPPLLPASSCRRGRSRAGRTRWAGSRGAGEGRAREAWFRLARLSPRSRHTKSRAARHWHGPRLRVLVAWKPSAGLPPGASRDFGAGPPARREVPVVAAGSGAVFGAELC